MVLESEVSGNSDPAAKKKRGGWGGWGGSANWCR